MLRSVLNRANYRSSRQDVVQTWGMTRPQFSPDTLFLKRFFVALQDFRGQDRPICGSGLPCLHDSRQPETGKEWKVEVLYGESPQGMRRAPPVFGELQRSGRVAELPIPDVKRLETVIRPSEGDLQGGA